MKTKAAVLYEYKKPLVVEELDLEGPKAGEVLVEYKAAGICHSDLSILNGVFAMPPIPCMNSTASFGGHSVVPKYTDMSRGTRVRTWCLTLAGNTMR